MTLRYPRPRSRANICCAVLLSSLHDAVVIRRLYGYILNSAILCFSVTPRFYAKNMRDPWAYDPLHFVLLTLFSVLLQFVYRCPDVQFFINVLISV